MKRGDPVEASTVLVDMIEESQSLEKNAATEDAATTWEEDGDGDDREDAPSPDGSTKLIDASGSIDNDNYDRGSGSGSGRSWNSGSRLREAKEDDDDVDVEMMDSDDDENFDDIDGFAQLSSAKKKTKSSVFGSCLESCVPDCLPRDRRRGLLSDFPPKSLNQVDFGPTSTVFFADSRDSTKDFLDSLYEDKLATVASLTKDAIKIFPKLLYKKLMTNRWKMKPSKIIFSILGTATNMDRKMLEDCEILMKNLLTPLNNVMLLTTGMNRRVEKMIVGKVLKKLKEQSAMTTETEDPPNIVGFGIAAKTWVKNIDEKKDLDETWHYIIDSEALDYLNPHHSYYLMLDQLPFRNLGDKDQFQEETNLDNEDERVNDFVDDIRHELEAQWMAERPLSQILFEGDLSSLASISKALSRDIPCIVIEGTGGAADALAKLKNGATLEQALEALFAPPDVGDVEKAKEFLTICSNKMKLIAILPLNEGSQNDVHAKVCAMILEYREEDLRTLKLGAKLGMKDWIDKALKKVLQYDSHVDDIAQVLIKILVSKDVQAMTSLEALCKSDGMPKKKLDEIVEKIIKVDCEKLYKEKNFPSYVKDRISLFNCNCYGQTDRIKFIQKLILGEFVSLTSTFDDDKFYKRFYWSELLLWSLLAGKLNLALFIMSKNRLSYQMGAALFACCVLKKLQTISESVQAAENVTKKLMAGREQFEEIALKIVDVCHRNSQFRTKFLLLQTHCMFGNQSCFDLALKGDCLKFVAHDACQHHLNNIWYGWMSPQTGYLRIVLLICLPFLIPFFGNQRPKCIEEPDAKNLMRKKPGMRYDLYGIGIDPGKEKGPGTRGRFKNFYQSASVKFVFHLVSYFLFLSLFAILICKVDPVPWASAWNPTHYWFGLEVWIYLCGLNFIVQELTQFANESGKTFSNKFCQHYAHSKYTSNFLFNLVDLALIILTIGAFIARVVLIPANGLVSSQDAYLLHHTYIAIFMLFCLRWLQIYLFFTELGPKLLMLRGIFVDFFHFLTVIFVFWLAYGIGAFAMMSPLRAQVGLSSDHWTFDVVGIFLEPYWALFGSNSDFEEKLKDGNKTLKNETLSPSEGHQKAMLNIILPLVEATYMLFGVFLLLNLIIALFSNTIDSINKQSQLIWKFSRVEMVYEYHERTIFPAPFSLVTRLAFIIHWMMGFIYEKVFHEDFWILPRVIISKMTSLDIRRLMVKKHKLNEKDTERFLRLLRKYEKHHASTIEIKTTVEISKEDESSESL